MYVLYYIKGVCLIFKRSHAISHPEGAPKAITKSSLMCSNRNAKIASDGNKSNVLRPGSEELAASVRASAKAVASQRPSELTGWQQAILVDSRVAEAVAHGQSQGEQ